MLFSCSAEGPIGDNEQNNEENITPDDGCWGCETPAVSFEEIKYTHPNTELLLDKLDSTRELIEENGENAETLLDRFDECLSLYSSFETMKGYAEIRFLNNRNDMNAKEQFTELYTAAPCANYSMQLLLDAAEKSELSESFDRLLNEKDFSFESEFNSELSEEAFELVEEEAELVVNIMSVPAEVLTVSYNDLYGTLEEISAKLTERYGNDSQKYTEAMRICLEKLSKKQAERYNVLCIELIKIRSRLAEELGYSNYAEYMYSEKFDHSADTVQKYTDSIVKYAVPAYGELSEIFKRYFASHSPSKQSLTDTIQNLGALYTDMDQKFGEHFSQMIKGSLYSANSSSLPSGKEGTYIYLRDHLTPYVFVKSTGSVTDFTSMAMGFGGFNAGYVTAGTSSDEFTLLSAETMRLLSLAHLSELLPAEDHKYLLYSDLDATFSELISDAFYTRLEYEIYSLPYSQINSENIESICTRLADEMGIEDPPYGQEMTEALTISPLKAPLHCISLSVGLEIFIKELENCGEGTTLYNKLMSTSPLEDLDVRLGITGLGSPFDPLHIKEVVDELHFLIKGYYYFEESNDTPDKA